MSALAFHASIAGALPSKLKGLFSLLVLICLANIGHAQLGWGTPKMENPGAFSINFCEDDPVGEYQMNWVGVGSPATNPKLTVVLPAGITYLGGSIRDVVAHPGGAATASMVADTLEIALPNLTGAESGTVAFKLLYDCNADFSNPVVLDIAAASNEAVFTDVSSPINNTFAQPQLVINGSTNALVVDREVGDVFTREAEIEQTGQFSVLNEFTLDIEYESGLDVTNQRISDGVTTVSLSGLASDGGLLIISEATYPTLGWPFAQDDVWTISEDVEIVSCDSLASAVAVNYGCGGEVCQSAANLAFGVALDIAVPDLTASSVRTLPSPLCVEDGVQIEATFNMTGKAYDSRFGIETRDDRTYIDLTSIEIDYATGAYTPYTGGFSDRVDILPCGSAEAKEVTLDAVPGPIDGTSSTQVYRIRYTLLTCCPNVGSCNINTGNIYGVNTNLFTDDMCGNEYNTQTTVASFNMNSSSSSRIPAFLGDGTTEFFQYDIDAVYISNTLMNEGQVVLRFSVGNGTDVNVLTAPDKAHPNGTIVSGGTIAWYNAAATSSVTAAIVSLGGGNYEATFAQGDYYGTGSKLYFPATYSCAPASCGSVASSEMTLGLRMGDGSCGVDSDCLFTYLCETGSTLLDNTCCAGSCDGIRNTGFDVSRTTYGIADDDNDGCADADLAVDLSLVSTRRALQGDEMEFTTTGRVELNSNPSDSLLYVYFELQFPDAHKLGSNLSLEIIDASEGSTYSTNTLVVAPNGANSYLCYLATDFIRGSGTIPTNFKWEDNDEISIHGEFTVLESAACGVEQIDITSELYGGRVALPSGGDRLQCNSSLLAEYSRVGYSFDIFEVARAPYGCAGARYKYRVEFCIGGGPQGVQPFPYEIRNFAAPTQAGFEIPTGLVFDQLFLDEYRSSQVFGGSAAVFDEDITAFAKQADGYLFFDFQDWYTLCSSSAPPNGGYRFDIHAYYEGTCNSVRSQPDYYFEAELNFASDDVEDVTFRHDATAAGLIPVQVADLEPTTVQSIIYPYNQDAEWAFQIRELNNGNARNAWVMFASPSGGITPIEVQQEGSTIAAVNGIYQLGDISGGAFIDFNVKADYQFCEADSLMVFVGWDCSGYPTSASQITAGGLPCAVDTLSLKLIPEEPGIQQAVTREPAGGITPCQTFDYEIEIINTTNAILYEPTFELYIPYTAGIDIDPSSAQACWPCQIAPTASDFNYNLFTPTETIITPLGIRYIWDLESLIASFDYTANQGWPSAISPDTDSTRISITFEAETNCNFVAGDWMNFLAKGRNFCGEETRSFLRNGVQLEYPGISPPYTASLTSDPFPAFNVCSETTEAEISGTATFFDLTDGNDTLVIALPPSLTYSDITFDPAHLSGPPVLRSYGPVNGSFIQEVRIGVNAGLAGGTSIPWSITTVVDESLHLCDDPSTINVRAVRAATINCRGTVCVASAATSSLYPPPTLDLVADSIAVADLAVSVNCGMTMMNVDNVTIQNTGSFDITEDVIVDFYYDADNNLTYSVGDVLLGSSSIVDGIAIGASASISAGPFNVSPEQTCSIIAVATGCGCDPAVGFVNSISTNNAGQNPPTGCSVDALTVGCGEDLRLDGFNYNWFGLDGAPVDGIAEPSNPNTTIAFENFSAAPVTFQYILVTEHPSGICASSDTVTLSFESASPEIGDEIKVCPLSSGNMTGPIGFANYLWSPTTGLTDPTDPTTNVVSPSGAIDYTLTYETPAGCTKVFEQSVRGVVCTDLELAKEITSPPSGVGSNVSFSLVVTNQGPGGASGIVVSDTLPQNLSFVSATPGGQYDPALHLWTLPGVLFPDSSATLIIEALVLNEDPIYNVAEVATMDQGDLDSTPGNNVGGEDDQDAAFFSQDLILACRQELSLGIPDNFTSYQWTRNGVVLSGETSDSLIISSDGLYRVTVNGGQDPFGIVTAFNVVSANCVTVGDYIWEDINGNGQQDTGEAPLDGIQVYLFDDATGLVVDSAITDAAGQYFISDLPTGTYFVQVNCATLPGGANSITPPLGSLMYVSAPLDQGGDFTDSDVDASCRTAAFSIDVNVGDDFNIDAGFIPVANIGNYIWIDDNRNGIQDLAEMPAEGILVTLIDVDAPLIVGSTSTDVNGEYEFSNVPFGTYRIQFDFTAVPAYASYEFTRTGAGTSDTDSNADPISGSTVDFVFDPRNGGDLSIDAGIHLIADIGDLVWVDSNDDGIKDVSEDGLSDVTVTLFDGSGTLVASTMTDALGEYRFSGQAAGNYSICFDASTTLGSQEYTLSPQGMAGVNNQSQPNAISGCTSVFVFDPAAGSDLTYDAGFVQVASIGNFVWDDADQDGLQGGTESGVEGVTVNLLNSLGVTVASTTTNAAGEYLFTSVKTGTYSIEFDASTASSGLLYIYSTPNLGDGTNGSDAREDGQTSSFVFNALNGDDFDLDAGLIPASRLGDFVWIDDNNDGLQTVGESPVVGATVTLYDGVTTAAMVSTITDAGGIYFFDSIPSGSYFIEFDVSTASGGGSLIPTIQSLTNTSNGSDPDAGGLTPVFAFDSRLGEDLSWDAGFHAEAGIGDFVWVDSNGDGLQNAGEEGLEGVTVQLFESTGTLVATTLTVADGTYSFLSIPAGDYYLEFDASTSIYDTLYNFASANIGGDDTVDSDATVVVPSNAFALATSVFSFDPVAGAILTLDAGIQPVPRIGTVKRVASTANLPNGNLEITYEIGIMNNGIISLDSLSVIDDLAAQIGVGFVALSVNTLPSVSILSSTATVTPQLNPAYTGQGSNTELLQVSNADLLAPDEQVWIQLVVEVDPTIVSFPIRNQVIATGRGLDGNNNPLGDGLGGVIRANDLSDSGNDFSSSNPGEPGDSGGTDDPTPINCSPAGINIAGNPPQSCAGSPVQFVATHALTNVSYEWRVQGDVTVVATTSNPTFSPTVTTTYVLTVVNESADCFYNLLDSATITVVPASNATPGFTYTPAPDCSASDLFLESNPSGGSPPYTFSWTGPDGFTSSIENPVIPNATTVQNGTYEVTVMNAEGCSSTDSISVAGVVDSLAQPSIVSSSNPSPGGRTDLSVSSYTGTSVTYTWTTPGNTTQNISGLSTNTIRIDPTIDGVHDGVYTVSVEVDGCITTSESFTLSFFGDPTGNPTFMYTAEADCSAADLSLMANAADGASPYTYLWTGPAGFTSTLANPVIPNADATRNGSYLVTITDALDVSVVASVEVSGIVDPLPMPVITSTGLACQGGSTVLQVPAYTGSNVTYLWATPNGVTTGISGGNTNQLLIDSINAVQHVGSYTLEVNVDGCLLISAPYEVMVNPLPVLNVDVGQIDSCHGGRIELLSNASSVSMPLSFAWTGPNGFAATDANPIIEPATALNNGRYNLSVTDANGCTASSFVEVMNMLDPAETPVLNAPSICEGDDLILATSAGGVQYEWIGPNGASVSTLMMPGMTTSVGTTSLSAGSGNYLSGSWSVRVTNSNGCVTTSAPVEVDITSRPILTTTALGPYCENDIVELVASAGLVSLSTNDSISFAWYDADPRITSGLAPVYIGSTYRVGVLPQGQFMYWAIASINGCSSEVSEVIFNVNAQPLLSNMSGAGNYCEGDSILLSGQTMPGSSFVWSGPNGFSFSGITGATGLAETHVIATPSSSGAYTLSSTSPGGCQANPESQLVSITDAPNTPTLTVDTQVLCEGQPFTLSSSIYSGVLSVNYIWNFDDGVNGRQVLSTTSVPTLNIPASTAANTGIYSVQVELDGCTSFISNEINVTVIGALTTIVPTNVTTATDPGCEGAFVQLNVDLIPGATYQWVGPNNFTSQSVSPTVGPLTLADAGQYQVTINVSGCAPVVGQPTEVYVMPEIETPLIGTSGEICEGGDVVLSLESAVPNSTFNISYEWYRASEAVPIRTTLDPFITLTNLTSAEVGDYYLVVVTGNCRSARSNLTPVLVRAISTELATAGQDLSICAAQSIQLNAQLPVEGQGVWTSPTGAVIVNPTSPNSNATGLSVGSNEFIWTLSDSVCGAYAVDTVVYTIGLVPVDAANAGEDVSSCNEEAVALNAATPVEASGQWSQPQLQGEDGAVIVDPSSPKTQVLGLQFGRQYEFYWTLSEANCTDFDRDTVLVDLNEGPDQQALVDGTRLYLCDDEDIIIAAEEPLLGEGYWSTTSGARIANPSNSITRIDQLDEGENVFVWTLSNGSCIDYSSDSLIVVADERLEVYDDFYTLAYGQGAFLFDVSINDIVNPEDYTITFDTTGLQGVLTGDLTQGYTFEPSVDLVGETSIRYTYCHHSCPDQCATGVATFRIDPSDACIVPSIITPNGDGLNDAFIVPCVEAYAESYFCVFNRWGDEVYLSEDYKNDWEGTFKGNSLPAGTYFYVLKINDGANVSRKGYLLIQK